MPDAAQSLSPIVTELKVSAHLMVLDAGIYCVYHTPGSHPPDPATGLPSARLSLPPGSSGRGVTITGFRDDGWLGALDAAALIRVTQGPAQVMMTIYQARDSDREAPRLQVRRLLEGIAPAAAERGALPSAPVEANGQGTRPAVPEPAPAMDAEIAAHVQLRGDVMGRLGDWVGERGSQHWIEGFALSPQRKGMTLQDIEYQAVLGRGWLSPWSEGGQYCGSRGMALPILGLRVRLRGKAAETHSVQVSATFIDGTATGPVGPGEACEAESLAPLEAFCITLVPQAGSDAAVPAPAGAQRRGVAKRPQPAPAPKSAPAAKTAAAVAGKPPVPAAAVKRAVAPMAKAAKQPAAAASRPSGAPAKTKSTAAKQPAVKPRGRSDWR